MGWFARKTTGVAGAGRDFAPAQRAAVPANPLQAALQLGRYGLFIRPPAEWRRQAEFAQLSATALQKLDENFALVPAGVATIAVHVNAEPGAKERDVETAPFLLARCAVTNEQYQLFVDSGAYENTALWPEDLWPHLLKLHDLTGTPGPRFWQDGRHDRRWGRHPVVGLCWHEAVAYAAWAGLRLPTEAEWQVAAAWSLGPAAASPRRYPWGDALDLEACNVWASGHGHTLPVDGCPAGAAPNGVLQLVGNAWEWIDADLDCTDDDGREIVGEAPLKVIRGGAYDTYFPWQATSTFRSGLPSLVRAHNVGFRCALDLTPHT
ncbi:MAG: SUMF1/EgtB/PvdO family nonheme iron enzyme [Planctomycetota bacterium]